MERHPRRGRPLTSTGMRVAVGLVCLAALVGACEEDRNKAVIPPEGDECPVPPAFAEELVDALESAREAEGTYAAQLRVDSACTTIGLNLRLSGVVPLDELPTAVCGRHLVWMKAELWSDDGSVAEEHTIPWGIGSYWENQFKVGDYDINLREGAFDVKTNNRTITCCPERVPDREITQEDFDQVAALGLVELDGASGSLEVQLTLTELEPTITTCTFNPWRNDFAFELRDASQQVLSSGEGFANLGSNNGEIDECEVHIQGNFATSPGSQAFAGVIDRCTDNTSFSVCHEGRPYGEGDISYCQEETPTAGGQP